MVQARPVDGTWIGRIGSRQDGHTGFVKHQDIVLQVFDRLGIGFRYRELVRQIVPIDVVEHSPNRRMVENLRRCVFTIQI